MSRIPEAPPMIASASASGAENAIVGRITPFTLAELSYIPEKSANFRVPVMPPMTM